MKKICFWESFDYKSSVLFLQIKNMKFNNPLYENEELTYQDVFLFQNYFDWYSRSEVSIQPKHDFWTKLPIVSANMNAVTGKRMAETIARYGWLGVLPQDMSIDTLVEIINKIKSASVKYDTPITVKASNTIRDAMWIIHKRSHNRVVMVNENNEPTWIFSENDMKNIDQFSHLWNLKPKKLITAKDGISNKEAYHLMDENWISSLPIVNAENKLVWILTKKDCIRHEIYKPTLDKNWKLNVAVAVWIHWFDKIKVLFDMWINIFVLDTAHGYQKRMLESIKKFREEFGNAPIVIAWNVITLEATRDLIEAWANGVKVWIGPGAMCTTRMQTWVWRPQFTAVYKCSLEARKLWWFVWADGWVKEPRDVALALAAWANHVMLGTTFAWTYESTWDIRYDEDGLMYKENYGMASKKAVELRSQKLDNFEIEKRWMYKEWISKSKIYLREWLESVWDIVDTFTTWIRSSMSYVGAKDLEEFYEKAVIWVQTNAWFVEWTPHGRVRK